MKKTLICAALALTSSVTWSANTDSVRAAMAKSLGPTVKIVEVRQLTPGLYEVATDNHLIYTDADAKYILSGKLLDATTKADLTEQRLAVLNKVDFSQLPLHDAVKFVKGNGERVVAIFEDPNCGYCKKLRREMQQLDNITIYTFMYNILSEDSERKSKDIWCAPDSAKAWDNWMLNNQPAPTAKPNCESPNDRVKALGKKLRITATPLLVFTDGTRIPGAIRNEVLEKKFSNINN